MRKVMSLVLAVVLLVSVLPFAAFADDGVEPRAYTTPCPSCGRSATVSTEEDHSKPIVASPCNGEKYPAVHSHKIIIYTHTTHCSYCGYNDPYDVTRYYCITTGSFISSSAYWSLR